MSIDPGAAATLGQLIGSQDTPVRLTIGQAIVSAGVATVNVAGGVGNLRWVGGYVPVNGDAVLVALTSGFAWVLGSIATTGHPATGSVTSIPGGGVINVNVGGTSMTCAYVTSYSPVVGDTVALDWATSTPRVIGKIATAAAPTAPPPPAAPPGLPTTGSKTFAAVDAASWRDGTWRTDTGDVIQGDAPGYAGHPNNGAWFYGSAPTSLSGITVSSAQIWLPAGSSSVSTPTIHLYRHTSNTRPGTDVSRVSGPYDVTKPWGTAGWYTLNTAAAQAIVTSGGGISITGTPYSRNNGLSKDGQSGAIKIFW